MGFNPMKVTTKRVLRKLGGDKISGKVILPKTEVVGGSSYNGILGLVAGQKYVVALHDDEHDLTVEVVAEAEGDYVFFSDGAHFEIGDDHSSNEWYIDFGDFSGTLSIFIPETIHPIDPKYLVTEIRPADYGLDIVALINSGVKNTQISGTDAFWSEINRGYDFRIVADVDQASMSIIPQIITKVGGEIMSVGFVAQFVAGSMLTVVNVDLTNGRGMTYFRCGINNLDLG